MPKSLSQNDRNIYKKISYAKDLFQSRNDDRNQTNYFLSGNKNGRYLALAVFLYSKQDFTTILFCNAFEFFTDFVKVYWDHKKFYDFSLPKTEEKPSKSSNKMLYASEWNEIIPFSKAVELYAKTKLKKQD